ncbi:MAG: methyltransferase domain-containing protein [Chthoniobacterales bacterium]|jgi:malonyl-CoA O-methyltransferase|nr:methyltransferase domain-containing protein [Chthoniobacterales bacterium]
MISRVHAFTDFDRRAGSYARHARLQREAAGWLAEWLAPQIESPALEVGAGTGFFTAHLLDRAREIIAIDASPRMVEHGRSAYPSARWATADAANPPADGRPYRGIYSCSLLQWLPDPEAVFRRWHDLAAPGAGLLAGWFVQGTMESLVEVCPEMAPFRWRSPQEWESLLGAAGWSTERREVRKFEVAHATSALMLREVHNIGAVVTQRLGTGKLRGALRTHDARFGRSGAVTTPFVFMRLQARRA